MAHFLSESNVVDQPAHLICEALGREPAVPAEIDRRAPSVDFSDQPPLVVRQDDPQSGQAEKRHFRGNASR